MYCVLLDEEDQKAIHEDGYIAVLGVIRTGKWKRAERFPSSWNLCFSGRGGTEKKRRGRKKQHANQEQKMVNKQLQNKKTKRKERLETINVIFQSCRVWVIGLKFR